MKKRKKSDLGSLDSLLDTMTTVVGILVILLIVVQLDVSETVERILVGDGADLPEVTAEQVAGLRADFDQKVEASAQAAEKIPVLRGLLSNAEFRIENVNSRLNTVERQLKKSTDTEAAMQELSVLMKKQQKTISQMEQDLNDREAMLAKMYAKVESQPETPLPPSATIRLPDPKPAPDKAQPFYMLCVGNKLYPVDYRELNTAVLKGIEQSRAKKNDKGEIDGKAVVEFFKRLPIGNRHFRVEATVVSYRLRFVLHRKRTGGEDRNMIRADLSEFQKRCKSWDKSTRYLNYLVWPDSFSFYHSVRGISSRYNIPTGWRPTERKELYASYFGTHWTYGASKNKPKPADPNKPAPPPPPKPQNVID